MKSLILFLTTILFLCSPKVTGQSQGTNVVNTAGGNETANGLSLSWSLGEIMTETFVAGETVLTQGVLQPEITVTSVTDAAFDPDLVVYPNPALHEIHISGKGSQMSLSAYRLYDQSGRLLKSAAINNHRASVSISDLPSGVYILRVMDEQYTERSFKIVKR